MTSIFFYNGTYKSGNPLQRLTILEVQKEFGFQYMESNLTETLENCRLPQWMQSFKVLDEPEKYIAVHKTCSNISIGYGLVAKKAIPVQSIILDYLGKKEKTDDIEDYTYSFNLLNGISINAKTQGNLARLSNHLPHSQPLLEETPVVLANVHAQIITCVDGNHVFFLAKKDIKIGEEIGWDYGSLYSWGDKRSLHYINQKNNECFLDEPKNASYFLEYYSKVVEGYTEALDVISNDKKIIVQNLTNALRLKGEAYSLLGKNNDAFVHYKVAFTFASEIRLYSLADKANYLRLVELSASKLIYGGILSKHGPDCFYSVQDFVNSEIHSIIQNSDNLGRTKIEKLAELVENHVGNQCIKDFYYKFLAHYYNPIFSDINKIECCKQEQSGTFIALEQNYNLLLNVMCSINPGYYTNDVFIEKLLPASKIIRN